jgi:hypothetical protein
MAVWFGKVLERVPYKGAAGIAAKVGLDQGFAAPNMLALFFSATTLMQGKSMNDVKEKLSSVSSKHCEDCRVIISAYIFDSINSLIGVPSKLLGQCGYPFKLSTWPSFHPLKDSYLCE